MTQQAAMFDFVDNGWRDSGLARMSRNRWIMEARYIAAQIALEKGQVTTDDIQERFSLPIHLDPNVWGSVLKPPYFRRLGEQRSRRPEARGRWVHSWILNSRDTRWMRQAEAAL